MTDNTLSINEQLHIDKLSDEDKKKLNKLKPSKTYRIAAIVSIVIASFMFFFSTILFVFAFFGPAIVGTFDTVETQINENRLDENDPEYSELTGIIYEEVDKCLGINGQGGVSTINKCIKSFEDTIVEEVVIDKTIDLFYYAEGNSVDYFPWITNDQKDPESPNYVEPFIGLNSYIAEIEITIEEQVYSLNDWITLELNTKLQGCITEGSELLLLDPEGNPISTPPAIVCDLTEIYLGEPTDLISVSITQFYNYIYSEYYVGPGDPDLITEEDLPQVPLISEQVYEFFNELLVIFGFNSEVVNENFITPGEDNFTWYNFFESICSYIINTIYEFTNITYVSLNELIFYINYGLLGGRIPCDDSNLPEDSTFTCEDVVEEETIFYQLSKVENFRIDPNDLDLSGAPRELLLEEVITIVNNTIDSIELSLQDLWVDLNEFLFQTFNDINDYINDELVPFLIDSATQIMDWIYDPETISTFDTVDTYYSFAINVSIGLLIASTLGLTIFMTIIVLSTMAKRGRFESKWVAAIPAYFALIVPGVIMSFSHYSNSKALLETYYYEIEIINEHRDRMNNQGNNETNLNEIENEDLEIDSSNKKKENISSSLEEVNKKE